jgi:hypothetical protein
MIHLKAVTFNKNSEAEFPYHLPFFKRQLNLQRLLLFWLVRMVVASPPFLNFRMKF